MGTKMETPLDVDPVPAGDACGICWGLGKPFGDGETPDEIIVTFDGIEEGPTYNPVLGVAVTGPFTLSQDGVLPCKFFLPIGAFQQILVQFENGKTTIGATTPIGVPCFFRESTLECATVLGNGLTDDFKNGHAVITIPKVS